MTPERLEKAHILLNRYRHLQNIAENFSNCTGYRLMLRMEFKGQSGHCLDVPVGRNGVNEALNTLLDEADQQLRDLGVEL